MNCAIPLTLLPSPRELHQPGCTVAGRGQGKGQVPLEWTRRHATQKQVSVSIQRRDFHGSRFSYATMVMIHPVVSFARHATNRQRDLSPIAPAAALLGEKAASVSIVVILVFRCFIITSFPARRASNDPQDCVQQPSIRPCLPPSLRLARRLLES